MGLGVHRRFPGGCPGAAGSLVEHWLFIQVPGYPGLVRRSSFGWGGGTAGAAGGWVGTLLGPEGTSACVLVVSEDRKAHAAYRGMWRVRGRPYLEI